MCGAERNGAEGRGKEGGGGTLAVTNDFCSPFPPPGGCTGAMGGLLLDGEEAPPMEDISKWTVEEVCGFINGLAGCSEYAQVRERPMEAEGRG